VTAECAGLTHSQLTAPRSAGMCSRCQTALVSHGQSHNAAHADDRLHWQQQLQQGDWAGTPTLSHRLTELIVRRTYVNTLSIVDCIHQRAFTESGSLTVS